MSFVCPSKYPNDGSAMQHTNWLLEMPTHTPFLVQNTSRHLKPGHLSMSCGKTHTQVLQSGEVQLHPHVCVCVCVCACARAIIIIQPQAFRFFQVRGRHQALVRLVTQLSPTLCDPLDCSPPGKNTEVGCHSLLQGIFLT